MMSKRRVSPGEMPVAAGLSALGNIHRRINGGEIVIGNLPLRAVPGPSQFQAEVCGHADSTTDQIEAASLAGPTESICLAALRYQQQQRILHESTGTPSVMPATPEVPDQIVTAGGYRALPTGSRTAANLLGASEIV